MATSALDDATLDAMRAEAEADRSPFIDPAVLRQAQAILPGLDRAWLVRIIGHSGSWRYFTNAEMRLAVRAAASGRRVPEGGHRCAGSGSAGGIPPAHRESRRRSRSRARGVDHAPRPASGPGHGVPQLDSPALGRVRAGRGSHRGHGRLGRRAAAPNDPLAALLDAIPRSRTAARHAERRR